MRINTNKDGPRNICRCMFGERCDLVDSIRLTSTFDEVDYDTYRYRDDDYKYY